MNVHSLVKIYIIKAKYKNIKKEIKMKTNIITLVLALFLGCANAGDPGNVDSFLDIVGAKSPKDKCSDGTFGVTLRSYSGKYCDDENVCDLMKTNCFPGGKDPYGAASSECAKKCKSRFGVTGFPK